MKKQIKIIALLSIALPSLAGIGFQHVSAATPVVTPKATITITQHLMANNIIISESDAKALTESQLISLMKVVGKDLSNLKVDSTTLDKAHAGLSGADYLDISATWTTTNETAQAHLIVVSDNAVISADGQKAVNAYDTKIGIQTANTIGQNKDQKSLDLYTKAKTYSSDGTVGTAALADPNAYFTRFAMVAQNGHLSLTYNFSSTDSSAAKTINVEFTSGSLNMTSYPTDLEFGKLDIKPTNLIAFPTFDQDLVITDSRQGTDNTGWKLLVKETQPLVEVDSTGNAISGGHNLSGSLQFSADGQSQSMLSSSDLLVQNQPVNTTGGVYTVNKDWNSTSKKGIYLDVPVNQQYAAIYQGKLTWTLSDVPNNP